MIQKVQDLVNQYNSEAGDLSVTAEDFAPLTPMEKQAPLPGKQHTTDAHGFDPRKIMPRRGQGGTASGANVGQPLAVQLCSP